ncbi:MAG: hypothetical protein KC912_24920 [Proteobacteria bacterium]|nr:hypothetical protein [Pseudomonadota bacterium]
MNGSYAKSGPSHPLALGMTALLLLNDHVLKASWSGVITGKLSDVAFLVVAPIVVAAVLAHARVGDARARRIALVGVAAFFVVLQLWAPLGDTLAGWLGGVHTADPTDLLTLPALALTRWAWRPTPTVPLALPIAALACVATSWHFCPDSRYPRDGGLLDPNEPLALLWGQDTPPFDHPSLPASVRILDDQGTPVELIFARGIRVCPRGGLAPGRTYTFVIEQMRDVSANTTDIRFGDVGRTTFSTRASSTLPPITTREECEAAPFLSEVVPCRGDTGRFDTGLADTGAPDETGETGTPGETSDTSDTTGDTADTAAG